MKAKVIFIVVCSYLVFSCSERSQENPNFTHPPETKILLDDSSELLIKLDSITPYYSNCIQYVESDSIGDLITLNTFKSTISFYSLSSKKLSKRISFKNTDVLKPGEFDGFYLINHDSILISSSSTNRLVLINSDGFSLREYSITPDESNNFFSAPTISTVNPLIKIGKNIFISGFLGPKIDPFSNVPDTQVSNLRLMIDLESGHATPDMYYPPNYVGKAWGGNMMLIYRTQNDKNETVYSFPANHNLVITQGDTQKEVLGSTTLFGSIMSLNKNKLDAENRAKYYLENPSYGPIIFDKYRKIYYRIAYQAITQDDFDSKDLSRGKIKQASIIVLDEHCNFLGETVLPRFSYTETMFFISRDGLNIGKWEKSKLNEDDLIFGIFKFNKK